MVLVVVVVGGNGFCGGHDLKFPGKAVTCAAETCVSPFAAATCCLDTGVEFFLGHDMNADGHEGVAHATELGALAVEEAGLGRLEPELVDTAGHGVDLHAEGGHRPAWILSPMAVTCTRTFVLTGTTR